MKDEKAFDDRDLNEAKPNEQGLDQDDLTDEDLDEDELEDEDFDENVKLKQASADDKTITVVDQDVDKFYVINDLEYFDAITEHLACNRDRAMSIRHLAYLMEVAPETIIAWIKKERVPVLPAIRASDLFLTAECFPEKEKVNNDPR